MTPPPRPVAPRRLDAVFAHAARLVLLVGALLAVGTLLAWRGAADRVNAFGEFLVVRHTGPPAQRLAAAEELEADDPDGARHQYEELLAELDDVWLGDRLWIVKRGALNGIVRVLTRAREHAEALRWYERWLALAPNDLLAQAGRLRAASEVPELRAEALGEMKVLFERVPELGRIAMAYRDLLVEERRVMQAFEMLQQHYDRARTKVWSLEWGAIYEPYTVQVAPRLRGADTLVLEIAIDRKPTSLKYVFPPNVPMAIRAPQLTISGRQGTRTLDVLELDLTYGTVGQIGDLLESPGTLRNWFSFEIPEDMRDRRQTYELSAEIVDAPRSLYEPLVFGQRYAYTMHVLQQQGSPELIDEVERMRVRRFRRKKMQAFWTDATGSWREDLSPMMPMVGRIVDREYRFDARCRIDDTVHSLRIDLPEGIGDVYDIRKIILQTAEGEFDLPGEELELVRSRGLRREGSLFTVAGNDPGFVLALPTGGPVHVEALIVRAKGR